MYLNPRYNPNSAVVISILQEKKQELTKVK